MLNCDFTKENLFYLFAFQISCLVAILMEKKCGTYFPLAN